MAKGKSTPASSSTTAQSKKAARKATKNSEKQKKLIDISSEDSSSASDNENTTKNIPVRPVASNSSPNKCSRKVNNKDMNEDFAVLSSPSASSETSVNSSVVTEKTALSEAVPLIS